MIMPIQDIATVLILRRLRIKVPTIVIQKIMVNLILNHMLLVSPDDDSSDATSSSHNEDNPSGSNGQAAEIARCALSCIR